MASVLLPLATQLDTSDHDAAIRTAVDNSSSYDYYHPVVSCIHSSVRGVHLSQEHRRTIPSIWVTWD